MMDFNMGLAMKKKLPFKNYGAELQLLKLTAKSSVVPALQVLAQEL